jgi:hybrid cluster-associated redox disulfide protein
MTKALIHDEMLIGDVLARYPESAQIMQDFGLSCTSCSVNAFEPVRAGALSHGMSEENVDELMAALNELAAARQKKHERWVLCDHQSRRKNYGIRRKRK